jgi:hypothetical protein
VGAVGAVEFFTRFAMGTYTSIRTELGNTATASSTSATFPRCRRSHDRRGRGIS